MHRLCIVAILALTIPWGCNVTIGGFVESANPDASVEQDASSAACPGGGDPMSWFNDADGDMFGDPQATVVACEAPQNFIADDTDCNDRDSQIHPQAREVCGDDVDNNCSGADGCLPNLRALWGFDEPGGDVAADASGNEHTGTLVNGPQFSPDESLVQFDGIDDYIVIDHADDFLLDQGTVAAWFRVGQLDVAHGLFSKDSSGLDEGGHLTISVTSANTVRMRLQGDENSMISEQAESTPQTIGADAWHHVAGTFGPDGMVLYVDGAEVARRDYTGGTGMTSGGAGNTEPLVLGSSTSISEPNGSAEPTSAPLLGDLADVRVYDRALTPQEIADVMSATAPAP